MTENFAMQLSTQGRDAPAELCHVKFDLAPKQPASAVLLHALPNRKDWFIRDRKFRQLLCKHLQRRMDVAGNASAIPALESKTLDFVKTFLSSSYPDVVKKRLIHISTLEHNHLIERRTDTFRWKDLQLHRFVMGTAPMSEL